MTGGFATHGDDDRLFEDPEFELLHPTLADQLRAAGVERLRPVDRASFVALLQQVDHTYRAHDLTRSMTRADRRLEHPETVANLARALRDAQQAAEAKSRFLANMSHEIRTPMNGLPEHVLGDPGRVRQVLINLVGNAIKFTPRGGVRLLVDRVDVAGRDLVDPDRAVNDRAATARVKRIEDLFTPFAQLDASTTRTYGGTGLGLSICRETVNLLGGNLAVASEVGVGSSFAFTIPVGSSDVPDGCRSDQPSIDPDPPLDRPGPHLLVAEDNAVNQILIRAILDHMVVTHEVVSNGLEAVEVALDRPFTAVLMDCEMPVLDECGHER